MRARKILRLAKVISTALVLGQFSVACTQSSEDIETPAKRSSSNATGRDGGCLWVVNGVTTNDFPAVVMLSTPDGGTCTGTFVSGSTVITAAHCLASPQNPGLLYNNIAALGSINFGVSGETAPTIPWQDVAILMFPDGTGPASASLAAAAPKAGDAITIVGYGQTDFINNNDVDGYKRYGRNQISAVTDGGVVVHYEAPANTSGLQPGQMSMSGRGDSGGPLFTDSGLVAITSNGGYDGTTVTETDVSLFSNHSLELFEMALQQGAVIAGIDNVRRANGVATGGGQPTGTGQGQGTLPNGTTDPSLQGNGQMGTGTSGQNDDCK